MKHYLEKISAVFSHVKSAELGLKSAEAVRRLEKYGKNKLDEPPRESLLKRFFSQMTDPMIIILLVAALLSAVLTVYESFQGGQYHFEFPTDTVIILVVVILNAILGVYQESKAEKAIEALQEMSAAKTRVLRDGQIISVRSEELVIGDVVLLEAGDAVPADCRIFESASLKIEEAALTGESVPVSKMIDILNGAKEDAVPLGDRKNMAYMGSVVVYGRGKAVVVATGMNTEMGKIADAISKAEEGLTPLQIKLSQISKVLTRAVLGICVFIFALSIGMKLLEGGETEWISFSLGIFMMAVSLAVAAIPEGLVAVVTIVLSIGVTRMSKKNAIIRKLTAVETLGCTQIICSDKTGTLTQNKMTVTEHYSDNENLLATCMALCNDASQNVDGTVIGEPTEAALLNYAISLKMSIADLLSGNPRVSEAPFDSSRKMMSTIHQTDKIIQYTKGAPDEILKHCNYIVRNGEKLPFTDELRQEVLTANKAMANKALRVIAAAYKEYDAVPASADPADLENDLVFIGLTGMIDPVRPEVKAAIDECNNAGICAVMITGDHKDTARAIAMELGILKNAEQAITGAQLDLISDEEFLARVEEFSVYARVQPEHKTRIVNAWRTRGYITAMTGDGVNDAPSIKNADIGIGMGITGTDVTKNVADMVLADDNFATIVSAVGEGRRIYDNIRRTLQFLLSTNLSEVITVLTATLMGFIMFQPVHLLFINLVTDALPAVALGMEHAEEGIMNRPPRCQKDGVFSGGLGVNIIYQGVLIAILTIAAYFIVLYLEIKEGNTDEHSRAYAMTAAFFTLSMCEIFHAFVMRSIKGSTFTLKKQNAVLWVTLAVSLVMTLSVIYIPFLAEVFSLVPLTSQELTIALILAISVIPVIEVVKIFQRARERKLAGK
ncbi:MAG: calcium-translocating P-type ATPase, PMCA-type [Oscillospiraceae bacterium]|nr:calcium-translocating P-type ATPase, PMCA-type [Oscillospiraceae bacterium]